MKKTTSLKHIELIDVADVSKSSFTSTQLRNALVVPLLALGVMSAPASAQEWYGQVFGGYSIPTNPNYSGIIGGGPQSVHVDLDDGYNLGLSAGTTLPQLSNESVSFRGELELSYSESDVDGVNFSGNGPGAEANPGGSISSTNLFANLIADFNTGSRFTPYVGAGLGVGFVDQDVIYGPAVTISGQDEVFASQFILGGAYDVQDNIALFADARYVQYYDVAGTRTAPGGVAQVTDDLSALTLNVGLRFGF